MATENLKVKITADAAQAKAEIGKFKDSLKGAVSEGEAATKSIGKMTAALGTALVTLKAIKTLVKNGIDVAAQGDAIKDNAQKVFMSTTAYQEWGYVLKQNGIEIGALKVGMRQFAQQVANGSDALAKYGITATDVDTAFEQAIATIQNMPTETEKIAAATELFGSRALELFPILNLNNAETQNLMATYRALGGTMSNELIAASDVCTDSITAMKAAWGGLRNVLAQYFIPIITKVVQWITVAIAYVRILLSAIFGLKETFGGKSKKNSVAGAAASTAASTGGMAKNLGKAAKNAKELRRTLMGIDELSKLAEQATAAAASGGGGGGGGISSPAVGVGDVGSFDGIISDETLEKIKDFQEKIDAVKDKLNGAYLILKGLVEISLGNPIKGFEDLKEGILKLFPGLKELKEKWTDMRENVAEKVLEFKAQLNDKVKAATLNLREWWYAISVKARNFSAVLNEKVKKAAVNLRSWWYSLHVSARNFTAVFVDRVRDAWQRFKNWWNGLKDGIKTFGVNFSLKDTLKNGWNSLVDKIDSARSKSAIARTILPNLPYLAKGGILTAPTTAMLGEYAGARSNPEIATPQSLMYETIQRANGDMVAAFATMTRQVIAAIEDKDLSVRIGDEAIAKSAQRGNTAYYNRTGKALLTI